MTVTETLDFGGLTISFDERVLRPRPWTLSQSRWAAELMERAPEGRVLELCTGAGHIGLASVADNDRALVCVDLDEAAVALCRANAVAAGLDARVEVRQGRLEEAVAADERFAVVVADPPWVRAAETGAFPEDPLLAIDGGDDGLVVARACLQVVERHLLPGGTALVQLGSAAQAATLGAWVEQRGALRPGEVRTYERGAVAAFTAA